MTVKKIHFLAILLLSIAVVSCQHDPSTDDLHEDYLVYTAYDTETDFGGFADYFLPDSILLIGNSDKSEYWKDDEARKIVARVAENLDRAGYNRVEDKDTADIGIQLSYVKQVTYYAGYDRPYWWWYYPYYWSPGYWGDWQGWYYPYSVYYGYTAGSLLIEMLNLEKESPTETRLPVVWDSFMGGLLTSSDRVNLSRLLTAVDQAFTQSPYLQRKQPR